MKKFAEPWAIVLFLQCKILYSSHCTVVYCIFLATQNYSFITPLHALQSHSADHTTAMFLRICDTIVHCKVNLYIHHIISVQHCIVFVTPAMVHCSGEIFITPPPAEFLATSRNASRSHPTIQTSPSPPFTMQSHKSRAKSLKNTFLKTFL